MKTILIEVPLRGNITPYEVNRQICNRLEQREPAPKVVIPKMEYKSSLKPSGGMWNLLNRSIQKYLA